MRLPYSVPVCQLTNPLCVCGKGLTTEVFFMARARVYDKAAAFSVRSSEKTFVRPRSPWGSRVVYQFTFMSRKFFLSIRV